MVSETALVLKPLTTVIQFNLDRDEISTLYRLHIEMPLNKRSGSGSVSPLK